MSNTTDWEPPAHAAALPDQVKAKTPILEAYLRHYASPPSPSRLSSQQWLDEYSTLQFALSEGRRVGSEHLPKLTSRLQAMEDTFHTYFGR